MIRKWDVIICVAIVFIVVMCIMITTNFTSSGESNNISSTDKIIKMYGSLCVTDNEVELIKFEKLVESKKSGETYSELSTNNAIDIVLKRKLLIKDAKERGLSISQDKIDKYVSHLRVQVGLDENGMVTTDEELKRFLDVTDLTYFECEELFKEKYEYSLLYYEYAKLIYEESKAENPEIILGDELVENYLNGKLDTLKAQ